MTNGDLWAFLESQTPEQLSEMGWEYLPSIGGRHERFVNDTIEFIHGTYLGWDEEPFWTELEILLGALKDPHTISWMERIPPIIRVGWALKSGGL